jgi:hypothetical protein
MKAFASTLALLTVSLMIGWAAGGCMAYLLPTPFEMSVKGAHVAYTLAVSGGTFAGFMTAIYYGYE